MSIIQTVKSFSAKAYENIGKRIHIQQNKETLDLLKKDSIRNMKRALREDGHTGFLAEKDGLEDLAPFVYKGYVVLITKFQEDGWQAGAIAKRRNSRLAGSGFDSMKTMIMPTEHICGQTIKQMIDSRVSNQ
jgi:hypothetical protein